MPLTEQQAQWSGIDGFFLFFFFDSSVGHECGQQLDAVTFGSGGGFRCFLEKHASVFTVIVKILLSVESVIFR